MGTYKIMHDVEGVDGESSWWATVGRMILDLLDSSSIARGVAVHNVLVMYQCIV